LANGEIRTHGYVEFLEAEKCLKNADVFKISVDELNGRNKEIK